MGSMLLSNRIGKGFGSLNNVLNVDFELYSSFEDVSNAYFMVFDLRPHDFSTKILTLLLKSTNWNYF